MKKTFITIAERIGHAMLPVLVSTFLSGCALVGAYLAWGFEVYAVINGFMIFAMAAILFAAVGIPVYIAGNYMSNEPDED